MKTCCYSLFSYTNIRSKSKKKKKKEKDLGTGNIKKRIEQGVYHNLLQEIRVSDRNWISGYLYNDLFSESNEEKCTAFQSMARSLIVHKNIIKTPQLLSKYFPSGLSLFVFFIFFFINARILLEFLNQAFSILYIFSPFSFVFMNPLINST